jgi:hypothetical protein
MLLMQQGRNDESFYYQGLMHELIQINIHEQITWYRKAGSNYSSHALDDRAAVENIVSDLKYALNYTRRPQPKNI